MSTKLQQVANEVSRIEEDFQDKLSDSADSITKLEHKEIVDLKNMKKTTRYGNVVVAQNQDYQWGVTNINGEVIVPFGKYGWIDGFDSGLARVRTHGESGRAGSTIAIVDLFDSEKSITGKDNIQRHINEDRKEHPEKYAKWGIINEEGIEVLPLIYDNIYGFLGKNRFSTTVELNGETQRIYFHDLNPSLPVRGTYGSQTSYYQDEEYDSSSDCFSINGSYDDEGNLDYDRLEDAAMDGEYLPDD